MRADYHPGGSDGVLNGSRAGELVVRTAAEPDELRQLFDRLLREDCVHSWRNIEPPRRASAAELHEWENELRPTDLFFFYAEHDGELRLAASSAVAARVSDQFPYTGFCVLSRCYVMPDFRGRGFYRAILQFRLEHCLRELGPDLRAVHIGTVDPRVAHVITRASLAGWPPFVHLGQERLHVSTQTRTVDDYIVLAPSYLRRLEAALAEEPAAAGYAELRHALGILRGAEAGRDAGLLAKRGLEAARAAGRLTGQKGADFDELVTFCAAVPLIGFEENHGALH